MKTTTIRIGTDLWALLESEAQHVGVSVSQYIRDAALARAAFAAGARVGAPPDLLARWTEGVFGAVGSPPGHSTDARLLLAALQRSVARDHRESAVALRAEAQQAQHHTRDLTRGDKPERTPAKAKRT